MHVALTHPDVHVVAAGQALHVRAEELVRQEQDRPVGRDGGDDRDRVGRRTADVGLGLDLGARVDVRDDDSARVLGLPGAQLVSRDGVGDSSFAVSAMKCTPANTIVDASVSAAIRDSARESPTWSATSWISGAW
jgi:hypothetical protein